MYTPNFERYNSMKYNRCGNSGLMLPAVSLGLWHNFGGFNVTENQREMASVGQLPTQAPHSMHSPSAITALSASILIALTGQLSTQAPQPTQVS